MKLQRTLTGLLLCLLMSTASANPYPRYPGSESYQASSPTELFERGIKQLTMFLSSRDSSNAPPLEIFVDQTIAPFFDFAYMAQWTAGPRGRYMSPQQKAAMQEKLRRIFLAAMVEKLASYRHGHVQFLPPVGNPRSGEVTLRLLAYQQGSPYPQRLSFRMYRSHSGWKVFDVSANGQSALAFYRTQFALEARRTGPAYNTYARPPYGYPN